MKVSVAICTWNRSRLLRQTLSSLLKLEMPNTLDWELIVVDNGSTDDTAAVIREFAEKLPIQYLHEPVPGHSRCRNRAIEVAEGDLLLWTDDDVIVSRNWLADYARAALEYPQASFFGSQIIPQFEDPIPAWLNETWPKCQPAFAAKDLGEPTRYLNPGQYPFGANFAIRGPVQRQYLFDVHLGRSGQGMLGDDETNVLQRLTAAGHQGVWLSGAVVYHVIPPERATADYLSRYFVGQGTANVMKGKPTTRGPFDARWTWLHHRACHRWKAKRTSADEWVSHLIQSSIAQGELLGWKWIQRNPRVSVGLPRILFATDVPFWRRETGAHQRIANLIGFLQKRQFPVSTVFLGSLDSTDPGNDAPTDLTNVPRDDRQVISQQGFSVWSIIDDWKPGHLLERLRWQIRCLWHGIKRAGTFFFNRGQRNACSKPVPQQTRRLSDFESPEFFQRFQRQVTKQRPDVVIIEYVTLSYLVKPHPRPESPRYWIDTHDLLAARKQQFEAFGFPHWLDIELPEEAECLKKFDMILAIQPREAEQMLELTHQQTKVLVVGHAIDLGQTNGFQPPRPGHFSGDESAPLQPTDNIINQLCPPISGTTTVKIGYLASYNAANAQALHWFLEQVWPALIDLCRSPISLIVAGGICQTLSSLDKDRDKDRCFVGGVHLLESVPSVPEFYQSIDIIINPIQFGSGLKIKTIEALTFGKPLVTTSHGILGLEELIRHSAVSASETSGRPLAAANSAREMVEILAELIARPEIRSEIGKNGYHFAKKFLSPDFVYRDLINSLLEIATVR
jgi:glycosyltransferase involved in cell wall biosynthesis